ncbi:hypothetical protein Sjap_009435 [Stephania japonica]|uniref:Pentatricopeptide repeat-containing protein n=1 Tax=Stephania japonica TaxID=461633 RepID=A0AAP0JS04_9MAGN
MLHRTRNGLFTIASNLFNPSILLSHSFSSNPTKPYLKNPNFLTKKPKTPIKTTPKHPQIPPLSLTTFNSTQKPTSISSQPKMGSSDLSSICSLLCNSVSGSRDLNIVLEQFKERLNSDLVLLVLMNYRLLGRTNTLDFFSWAGTQLGFCFDDSVVEYMADFLGRRKLFDDLKCLLNSALSKTGTVSCCAISISIRFLGRNGRVGDALCLFEEMQSEFNCKFDNFVYNNMLYVLCKIEGNGEFIDVALTIFRSMECPDSYSYSNVLVGLCKFGRLESAIDVFNEMGSASLVPTRSAINILIGALCGASVSEGHINKVKIIDRRRPFSIPVPNLGSKGVGIRHAMEVFRAMHGRGLLPSAFVIVQLISELCRLRKIDEAIGILNIVEERKLRCMEEGYTIVIRALCDVRSVDGASQLFGRMISKSMKPKLVVYNSIICLLCKLGNVEEAERIFEMMNKRRCAPDNVTYTALIHGYAGACNWEMAYKLSMEMLGMGWCPHYHTYNLVNTLLKENARSDLSLKMETKLETQLLHKHCKAGQLEEAYEKLRSMIEKRFRIPVYTRAAFEQAFQKAGKWKIARELLEKLDSPIQESQSMQKM